MIQKFLFFNQKYLFLILPKNTNMRYSILLFLVFTFIACTQNDSSNNSNNEINNNISTKTTTTEIKTKVAESDTGLSEKNLYWILGNWKRANEKDGKETYEFWKRKAPNHFVGLGFTLQGRDTVFKENMRLMPINGTWSLEVTGVNETPTLFPITEYVDKSFKCENNKNDYPKNIVYQIKGNQLQAVISGGGPDVSFLFDKYYKVINM